MLEPTTKPRPRNQAMRYIIQFVIPACLFLLLLYLVAQKKRAVANGEQPIIGNTTFVLLLVIGSGLTVGLLFGIAAL